MPLTSFAALDLSKTHSIVQETIEIIDVHHHQAAAIKQLYWQIPENRLTTRKDFSHDFLIYYSLWLMPSICCQVHLCALNYIHLNYIASWNNNLSLIWIYLRKNSVYPLHKWRVLSGFSFDLEKGSVYFNHSMNFNEKNYEKTDCVNVYLG